MSRRLITQFIVSNGIQPKSSFLNPGNISRCLVSKRNFKGTLDADGKTTAEILNKYDKSDTHILINTVSQQGYRMANGIKIVGPAILFPKTTLGWNVAGPEDVNEDSLILFKLLDPKPDIIIFGYGDNSMDSVAEAKTAFFKFCKKHDLPFEIVTTEKAIPLFNMLNLERRYVAAALIPPLEYSGYKYIHPTEKWGDDHIKIEGLDKMTKHGVHRRSLKSKLHH